VLSADVMRAGVDVKKQYSTYTRLISQSISNGLHKQDSTDSWALMALLSGAVMMARCVSDPDQEKEILLAAKEWSKKIIERKPNEDVI